MFGVIKFIWAVVANFAYLLRLDRNALHLVPDPTKYLAMIMLSLFWSLAFGIYVGEFLLIGHSMMGHAAVVTMSFVTWWIFRAYQQQSMFKSRNRYDWLRAPDRSARDEEMSDEQREQLSRRLQ